LHEEIKAKVEMGGEEIIHNLAPRWQQLCEEVRSAPFHRPEWILAYVRAFEPNSKIVLVTASIGQRLVAVLPMVRKRCFYAGVPVVKLAGTANSHSVRFDILRSSGATGDAAVRGIWNLLSDTPGWHILEFPLFPRDGACAQLMTLAGQDDCSALKLLVQDSRILRLRVNCDGKPAQPAVDLSRHFRHELRRYARVFTEECGVAPRVTRWSEPKAEILQQFFDLEEAGWKGRKGSAINCDPATRKFYREIAAAAAEHGYFCLHSLEGKSGMAAGAFSVATQDCFFPMKITHDEALRRGGPGHLLINAIVAECADKRIPELFFGGKDERYKSLWTQETLPHFSIFVFSQDFRSRLAYHVRKHVLSPLGNLRRQLLDRFAREHRARTPRHDVAIKTKKQGLVVVPQPSEADEKKTTVHTS
jgi:CelD/BcsL family acetyltransferase involved in cellulose biosynthesis